MIFASYSSFLFLLCFILAIFSIFLNYSLKRNFFSKKIVHKLILVPFVLVLLFIGLRSSFDSSTPNQSFYSISNSILKNEITNNSLFSLLYSYYLKQKEEIPYFNNEIPSFENKILNKSISSSHNRKKHLILVLMESFGKNYVGVLGGTNTSPNFDKMSKQGFFISNMYSSSNRLNRGLEAVISSAYPLLSNTYLKLLKSQKDFWTMAKTLKKKGYENIFLYGGDSKFDNMKGFLLANGFDRVIDLYDFPLSKKRFTWGVSDEVLFKKAENILSKAKKKTFLFVFTLSSHKPFDYPKNKISLNKKYKEKSFPNAIKYTDYVLGKFYKNLQKAKYFDNSLLALVADHTAQIKGKEFIPIKEFRIPALIIGKDIEKKSLKKFPIKLILLQLYLMQWV